MKKIFHRYFFFIFLLISNVFFYFINHTLPLVSFSKTFTFTEEPVEGNLPVHHLYRYGVEKFSSQTESEKYLCLVSLFIQTSNSAFKDPSKNILLVGGSDGVAVRNALTFSSVKQVHILDNDGSLFHEAKLNTKMRVYNLDSLGNKKTHFLEVDPFTYLSRLQTPGYDLVILDISSPSSQIDARFLSFEFFSLLKKNLNTNGMIHLIASEEMLPKLVKLSSEFGFESQGIKSKSGRYKFLLLYNNRQKISQDIEPLTKGKFGFPCEIIKDIPRTDEPVISVNTNWENKKASAETALANRK